MSNDTRTIDLVINNLTEEQFENVFSPDPNELWLTPDNTPEQLAEKVDKTSDPNKIYGTDGQGNQTTYAAGAGIDISGTTISNTGVREITTGTQQGAIQVRTGNVISSVAVYGLGTAAYTASSDYATAAQGGKADTAVQPGDLATVATTGSYNDLSNKPTIPAAQVNSDWDAISGVAQISNKPTLGTAAAADTTDFATAAQGTLASTALQPGDDITDLNNDAGYQTAGDVATAISGKQDTLTAGTNITITGATISATDTTYSDFTGASAGDAGTHGLVPAPAAGDQAKFLQGDGTWANPTAATAWGNITGTLADQTDLQNALNAKQNTLTAGTNINITGSTISATDTTYTGSDGVTLTGTNFTNSGVRAVATGTTSGTVSVNTNGTSTDVAVNGWSNKADAATTLAGYGITDGVTKGHELVAFQFPTGTNKLWYRKYADGWVEQGGTGSASTTGGAVTFPVVMDSTNYVHQVTNAGAQYGSTGFCAGDHTTTGMKLYCSYAQGRNAYWEIKGKAAS